MLNRRQEPFPSPPPAASYLSLPRHLASPVPSPTPLQRLHPPSSPPLESPTTSSNDKDKPRFAGRDPRRRRCAEFAGGATASCTAVCCCCPCGLLNLLVFVLFRLPAGLCRKAIRNYRLRIRANRKRKMLRALSSSSSFASSTSTAFPSATDRPRKRRSLSMTRFHAEDDAQTPASAVYTEDMKELEREMWDRFHNAGFWRSRSLTET